MGYLVSGVSSSNLVFHSRWSAYGEPYNNDENLDDEEFWYMENTQPYRANVAFSLYGILAGRRDRGCRRATFINSFYTRYGVQIFVQAMQMMGHLGSGYDDDYFSYGGGENNNEHNNNNNRGGEGMGFSSECVMDYEGDNYNDDGYSNYGVMGAVRYPNATSYSLGCTTNGLGFQVETYNSATCNRKAYTGTSEVLKMANQQLQSLDCMAIYDSSNQQYSQSYSDDVYRGGEENKEGEGDGIVELSYPLDVLLYSDTCNVLVDSACPDPYGRLVTYSRRMSQGTGMYHDVVRFLPAILLVLAGTVMLGLAQYEKWRKRARHGAVDVVIRPYFSKDEQEYDYVNGSGSSNGSADSQSESRHDRFLDEDYGLGCSTSTTEQGNLRSKVQARRQQQGKSFQGESSKPLEEPETFATAAGLSSSPSEETFDSMAVVQMPPRVSSLSPRSTQRKPPLSPTTSPTTARKQPEAMFSNNNQNDETTNKKNNKGNAVAPRRSRKARRASS